MRNVTASCLFAVAAVALPAQTTLLVGPGGHAQIRDAIANAQDGDIVVVLPGSYAQFVADKALTIRALTPGTVFVDFVPAFAPPGCPGFVCVEDGTLLRAPVTGPVHVVGLTFLDGEFTQGGFTARHHVRVQGGNVTFDQCSFTSKGEYALEIFSNMPNRTVAHLQACAVTGTGFGSSALAVSGASVTAIDCTFTGSTAPVNPLFSGASRGVVLTLAEFVGSHLSITGGTPSTVSASGAAVSAVASVFSISDATLTASVCPLSYTGIARLDRCQLSGGANCQTAPQVPLLGVTRAAPLQPGMNIGLQWHTAPNGLVGVLVGLRLATSYPSELQQPLWLDPAYAFVFGFTVADAQGLAVGNWALPASPALVDVSLWFQGVSGMSLPLAASPLAGGVVR